jgi:hypothetical protein
MKDIDARTIIHCKKEKGFLMESSVKQLTRVVS